MRRGLDVREIPRTLHFIWVGNDSLRPDAFIETWRRHHPDFSIKVWGNEELANRNWVTKRHMEWIMDCGGQYAAVADLMRWEILLEEGGVALDSDSICLERLPDWLFYCDLFASWENEYARPGIIANGYVGCRPDNNVITEIVSRLSAMQNWPRRFSWSKFRWKKEPAWKVTGPALLTDVLKSLPEKTATILPSHFFIPAHYSGIKYNGSGPVYSCEMFSSTPQSLNKLDLTKDPDQLVAWARNHLK